MAQPRSMRQLGVDPRRLDGHHDGDHASRQRHEGGEHPQAEQQGEHHEGPDAELDGAEQRRVVDPGDLVDGLVPRVVDAGADERQRPDGGERGTEAPAARKPARSNRLRVSTTSSSWIWSTAGLGPLAFGDRVVAGPRRRRGPRRGWRAGHDRVPRPRRRGLCRRGLCRRRRCRHGRTGSGTGADGACARRARSVSTSCCRSSSVWTSSLRCSRRMVPPRVASNARELPAVQAPNRKRPVRGRAGPARGPRGRPRDRRPRSDDPPRCVRTTGPSGGSSPSSSSQARGTDTGAPRRPARRTARPRAGAGRCRWTRRTWAPGHAPRDGDAHHVGHGAATDRPPGPPPRPRRRERPSGTDRDPHLEATDSVGLDPARQAEVVERRAEAGGRPGPRRSRRWLRRARCRGRPSGATPGRRPPTATGRARTRAPRHPDHGRDLVEDEVRVALGVAGRVSPPSHPPRCPLDEFGDGSPPPPPVGEGPDVDRVVGQGGKHPRGGQRVVPDEVADGEGRLARRAGHLVVEARQGDPVPLHLPAALGAERVEPAQLAIRRPGEPACGGGRRRSRPRPATPPATGRPGPRPRRRAGRCATAPRVPRGPRRWSGPTSPTPGGPRGSSRSGRRRRACAAAATGCGLARRPRSARARTGPASLWPVRSKCSSPAAMAAAGSSVRAGAQVPRSHTMTSPPPYSPDGITPSKSAYSIG